jgi:hypothetical protein
VSGGSLGLIQLERFTGSEAPLPRMVAAAKIARYKALGGDELLRLLGADTRDLETCGSATGLGELRLLPEARVELISVGDILLRGGSAESTLSPRLFPALATTASGWFYAGEAEVALPRAEHDEYIISAPGERGSGAFEVVVVPPGDVAGLAVGGVGAEQGVLLTRAEDAIITWESEDPGERVELELYAGGSVLSCALRDDGLLALSVAQLATLEPDDNASLVVRRVRVVPIDMQGIESAYVRTATTRAFPLQVR